MKLMFRITISFTIILFVISCSNDIRKSYWENGNLKSELRYEDGKLNGKAVWYFENGEKEMEAYYKNNILDGPLIRWYKNGHMETESYYQDGKLEGAAITYEENGNKALEENYKNDTLSGKFYQWYRSGSIRVKGEYINGLYTGRWVYYNNGNIVGIGNFENGNGIQKAWWPNGQLKREITYKNNLKNGSEKWYNADGELEKVLYFEDGIEVEIP